MALLPCKGDVIEFQQYSDEGDVWLQATVWVLLATQFISVDKHGTQRFHLLSEKDNTWRVVCT